MKYKILKALLCLCMFFAGVNICSAAGNKNEYVLILNSYNESSAWSSSITSVVSNHLSTIENLNVYAEHLNLSMAGSSFELEQLSDILMSKYDKYPPKAIIVIGSMGLVFRDQIKNIWGVVPTIVCGERPFTYPDKFYRQDKFRDSIDFTGRKVIADLAKDYNLTFMRTPVYLKENIELMMKVIPNMKKLLFLGDNIYPNPIYDMQIDSLIMENKWNLEYEFLSSNQYDMHQLYEKLRNVDSSTGILISTWFTETISSNGMMVNALKSISSITAPLFTIRYAGLNDGGMVGGYVYDEDEYGQTLIKNIDAILAGKKASDIPFYEPKNSFPKMNYARMQKKGLNPDLCPKNTVFYDQHDSFFETYRWYIIAALVLFILFFVLQHSQIKTLRKLKNAQAKQIEMQKHYTTLVNNMPVLYMKEKVLRNADGVVVDSSFVDINNQFQTNFYKREEIVGKKASEVFPESLAEFCPMMEIVLKEKRSVTFSYYFKEINTFYDVAISCSTDDETVDIFCLNTTELHKAQRRLSETNRKLALALEAANIIPWKWDLSENLITCDINHQNKLTSLPGEVTERFITVRPHQYKAKILKEDRERVTDAYHRLLEGKTDKVSEEYRVVTQDGGKWKVDWVEAQAMVETRDENGVPLTLVGSLLVITERKQMESDLVSAKEHAEESNRLKSAFLANMSHEIRTPLNAIVGFSNVLASTEDEDEKQQYIGIIESNNTLLLQLISDILDLSKIEAGTMEFCCKNTNLNEVIDEVGNTIRGRYDDERVKFIKQKPEKPCVINIDKNRIMQVLINFLTNACKFTREGSITCGYEQRGDELYFYVTDTGCGIPEDKREEIFERFVKLDAFAQGTGLGLAICQMIIEHFKGKISVDSELGKGSTFWFTLPYEPVEIESKKEEAYKPISVQKDKLLILVAEDNESNYTLFHSILKREYTLIHAWDGKEAVELFKKHNPQIILMDLNMPIMDGYEATREIRKLSSNVPIIAVTAFAYASDELRVMESGFDGYMSKPINAPKLRQEIVNILRNRIILL